MQPTPMRPESRAAAMLQWIGAIGIVGLAVARCLIVFVPQVVFDVDPARVVGTVGGLGPAGSILIDLVMLLAAALTLVGAARSSRGLDALLILLAVAPIPVWILVGDAHDLRTGLTWIAGAISAAALAHAARDGRRRLVLLALLLAVAAPLLARAALQAPVPRIGLIGSEYADLLAEYDANRDRFLAERAWAPDSPAARIYERRVLGASVRGWFTTTNILASLMAFTTVTMLGLVIAATRRRLAGGVVGLLALLGALAGVTVWLSGSKGAILATLVGLGVLGAMQLARRHAARWGGALLLGVVALALLGVVVRGAMLPEGFLGDRSLLFRWHYMVGAAEIIADHPLTGVGADGFQGAYTLVRPARSPEEVASAHSFVLDWLAAFGVWGAAGIALAGILLWRAGRPPEDDDAPLDARSVVGPAILLGAVAVGGPVWIEQSTIPFDAIVMRALGVVGYAAVAAILVSVFRRLGPREVLLVTAAGLAALVVHGQIEMTWTQPGAAAWCWCVLGVLGGARSRGRWRVGAGAAVVGIGAAVIVAAVASVGAVRAEILMRQAANQLTPLAELGSVLRDPDFDPRDRVARCAALGLPDPAVDPTAFRTMLGDLEASRRLAAAARLDDAASAWPVDPIPAVESARQRLAAAERSGGRSREGAVRAVRDDTSGRFADDPAMLAVRLAAAERVAALTGDPSDLAAAVDLARALAGLDPQGIAAWRRLGDRLWDAARHDEARAAYRRAVAADAAFSLDPLKQLTPPERARIDERLAGAAGP
ncbi:MAG: O-antigen ligase family protein [Phycisphaerales bacterium]|nr:O-antigen ligase family protein [Phycisphaerales bacterium]